MINELTDYERRGLDRLLRDMNMNLTKEEKWLDDDGETWLMDPYKEILTDTDRARLAGCAPDLLAALKLPETSAGCGCDDCRKVRAARSAAIAKAEGIQGAGCRTGGIP